MLEVEWVPDCSISHQGTDKCPVKSRAAFYQLSLRGGANENLQRVAISRIRATLSSIFHEGWYGNHQSET